MRSLNSWRSLFFLIGLVWLFQASTLGMSDDEAYYWVLSKTPAWGYVYHPPVVAWSIAAFRALLSWISLVPEELLTRLPGITYSLFTTWVAVQWVRRVRQDEPSPWDAAWLWIPGLSGIAWMMVPDHSLFLGWMITFYATWKCTVENDLRRRWLVLLTLGAAFGMLSKFSAILYCISAGACVLGLGTRKTRALVALGTGLVVAAIPILYWNWKNDWVALLYQFHSRHSGSGWSGKRYGIFWVSQLLIAGPALIWGSARFLATSIRRPLQLAREERFVLAWFLPAVIFLIQPAFSEFKPHWAIIAWLPMTMLLAAKNTRSSILAVVHGGHLFVILLAASLFTQLPLGSALSQWWTGQRPRPVFDVSNDLRGWSELPGYLDAHGVDRSIPVLGSRYQTASQAAFSLRGRNPVSLVPKSAAEALEWPYTPAELKERGRAEWPALNGKVLYVADERYRVGPRFVDADCKSLGFIGSPRWGFDAKQIQAWLCQPRDSNF